MNTVMNLAFHKWIELLVRSGIGKGKYAVDCCVSGSGVVVLGLCECSNEPSGSEKCGEFLD